MKTLLKLAVAGAIAIGAAAHSAPSLASAFFGWAVADVPAWDTLNVRAFPGSRSPILVAYPNGAALSMTGTCTGGTALGAIAGWPAAAQRDAVRFAWCELWLDPEGDGSYRTGWVYGKYIRPM